MAVALRPSENEAGYLGVRVSKKSSGAVHERGMELRQNASSLPVALPLTFAALQCRTSNAARAMPHERHRASRRFQMDQPSQRRSESQAGGTFVVAMANLAIADGVTQLRAVVETWAASFINHRLFVAGPRPFWHPSANSRLANLLLSAELIDVPAPPACASCTEEACCTHAKLGKVAFGQSTGWKLAQRQFLFGLGHAHRRVNRQGGAPVAWYMCVDDDTLVVPSRLQLVVGQLEHTFDPWVDRIWLGRGFSGAGIVFSAATLASTNWSRALAAQDKRPGTYANDSLSDMPSEVRMGTVFKHRASFFALDSAANLSLITVLSQPAPSPLGLYGSNENLRGGRYGSSDAQRNAHYPNGVECATTLHYIRPAGRLRQLHDAAQRYEQERMRVEAQIAPGPVQKCERPSNAGEPHNPWCCLAWPRVLCS